MTILRRYSLAVLATLSLPGQLACSSDAPEPDGAGASSGSTGASGSSGASGSNGASSDELLGTFKIEVTADETGPTTGTTSVLGKVSTGTNPATVIWEESARDGACRLEKPRVPFCSPGCGSDVCVEDGVCRAYPTALGVGTVTLSGVALTGGETTLTLKEVAKAYQAPPGTKFAYPPFAEGDDVTLRASGAELPAFEITSTGVAPIWLGEDELVLESGKPLALRWTAASDPSASSVHVKLDISHHGGSKGMIECDADDTGELSIPAALVKSLLELGVAGFPTVIVTRAASARVPTTGGQVALVISSNTERAVTVPGVDSCTSDEQCPAGKKCQADLTCQ